MRLSPTDSQNSFLWVIGNGSSVEIVNEFCYLGDTLSVDGNVDTAVTARIRSGWFEFRSKFTFTFIKIL